MGDFLLWLVRLIADFYAKNAISEAFLPTEAILVPHNVTAGCADAATDLAWPQCRSIPLTSRTEKAAEDRPSTIGSRYAVATNLLRRR